MEKVNHAVRTLCRGLPVSRAAYYQWCHHPRSEWAQADAGLTARITSIHARSRHTYGAPRVQAELRAAGQGHSRKRVARLMRLAGLAGRYPRRVRRTTIADPLTSIPDLVQRDFAPTGPDQLGVGDITYIRTWEGWLYLAVLLDCYSRRVVDWSVADHLRTELPLAALRMALACRRPAPSTSTGAASTPPRPIPRSCRGTASDPVSAGPATAGTALAESFNGLYKTELIRKDGPWRGLEDVEFATLEYLDWFNRRRLHTELGMVPPLSSKPTTTMRRPQLCWLFHTNPSLYKTRGGSI